ncbi:Uncharacterised protein [uncultured archaeon]|nr:Uncharacterised protein [uncultured archaeon]
MKLNSYKIPKRLEKKEKYYEFSQHFGLSVLVFIIFLTLYFQQEVSLTATIAITVVLGIILFIHYTKIKRN